MLLEQALDQKEWMKWLKMGKSILKQMQVLSKAHGTEAENGTTSVVIIA